MSARRSSNASELRTEALPVAFGPKVVKMKLQVLVIFVVGYFASVESCLTEYQTCLQRNPIPTDAKSAEYCSNYQKYKTTCLDPALKSCPKDGTIIEASTQYTEKTRSCSAPTTTPESTQSCPLVYENCLGTNPIPTEPSDAKYCNNYNRYKIYCLDPAMKGCPDDSLVKKHHSEYLQAASLSCTPVTTTTTKTTTAATQSCTMEYDKCIRTNQIPTDTSSEKYCNDYQQYKTNCLDPAMKKCPEEQLIKQANNNYMQKTSTCSPDNTKTTTTPKPGDTKTTTTPKPGDTKTTTTPKPGNAKTTTLGGDNTGRTTTEAPPNQGNGETTTQSGNGATTTKSACGRTTAQFEVLVASFVLALIYKTVE